MKKQVEINGQLQDIEKCEDLIAYDKQGKIYDVFKTVKSFTVGMCLGSIQFVVDGVGKILYTKYPLFGGSDEFEIEEISKVKEKAALYNEINKQL